MLRPMLFAERTIVHLAHINSTLRYWFIREHALHNITVDGAAAFRVGNEVAYYHLRRLDAFIAVSGSPPTMLFSVTERVLINSCCHINMLFRV